MPQWDMLRVLALLEDLPDKGLRRRQAGTIVEALAPGVFEVEFSGDYGEAYASAALSNLFLGLLRLEMLEPRAAQNE
jgi:hypothetical protein